MKTSLLVKYIIVKSQDLYIQFTASFHQMVMYSRDGHLRSSYAIEPASSCRLHMRTLVLLS